MPSSLTILSTLCAILGALLTIAYLTSSPPTTGPYPANMIPIVALGVYRDVAAKMDPLFVDTPFRMTAILDLKQDPKSVRYHPQNLLTVLFNLHPRPMVFITGAAISHAMTAESITVWESYVRDSKTKDTFLINLCDEPPPGGDWVTHIMRKLSERYGKTA